MTEEVKDPSGVADTSLVDKDQEQKQSVNYETYQKAVSQEKNVRERLKAQEAEAELLKEKLALIDAERAEAQEKKLNEKGEYQKLVELKEKQIAELGEKLNSVTGERDNFKSDLTETFKLQAVYAKLPGQIKKPDYLTHLDLNSIVIDPDTGRIDSSSVDNVVADFVENHGDLLKSNDFSGLPSDAAKGSLKPYSTGEWKTLSAENKRKNWSRRPKI